MTMIRPFADPEISSCALARLNKIARLLLVVSSTTFALVGCVAEVGSDPSSAPSSEMTAAGDEGFSATEQALISGGPRLGYTCSAGKCVCDKSVPNDCKSMEAKCLAPGLDRVYQACLNNPRTTSCDCIQQATKVVAKKPIGTGPIGVIGAAR
jgi:hypothetical protein